MNSTLKLTKFSIWNNLRALIVFYSIYLSTTLLFSTFTTIALISISERDSGNFGGFETAPFIYAFIAGICSVSQLLNVAVVNSCTRKNAYLASMLSLVPIVTLLGVIDMALQFIVSKIANVSTIFTQLFGERYSLNNNSFEIISAQFFFEYLLWSIVGFFAISLVGICIGAIYYRMEKYGRVIFSVLFFGGLMFGFPLADEMLFGGELLQKVGKFILECSGVASLNPYYGMITALVIAVIMGAISFIMMRRTPIKKA